MKDQLAGGEQSEEPWEEKVNQIRIYSGEKYEMVQEAAAGMIQCSDRTDKDISGRGT